MATPIPTNASRWRVTDIAPIVSGALQGSADANVVALTTDSRAVAKGVGFVALRGERIDGHAFVKSALDQGASCVIVDAPCDVPPAVACIVVKDTLEAWGALGRAHARRWRERASASAGKLLALTGSAGKTTTKEIAASLLATFAPTHATVGNLNNRIGVPATLLCLEDSHAFGVIELGMSVPGEMAKLTAMVEPDVGLLLNVGLAHAEGVGGGRDAIGREKGALLEGLARSSVCVVNADDDQVMRQVGRTRAEKTVTFGQNGGVDYALTERVAIASGSRLTIARRGQQGLTFDLPLHGAAAAIDCVAAVAAVEAMTGRPLTHEQVRDAMGHLRPAPGRFDPKTLPNGVVLIDDAYNANPESMRQAIRSLKEFAQSRRTVVVLGEMRELGAFAEAAHRDLAQELRGIAIAIGCGGLVDLTLREASAFDVATFAEATASDAAARARELVRPGDVVLVKASRSIGAERVVIALTEANQARAHAV